MAFMDAFDQPLSGHLVLVLDREAVEALRSNLLGDPDPGVPNAVLAALDRYLADPTEVEMVTAKIEELGPGVRVVDGEPRYSAAWLDAT